MSSSILIPVTYQKHTYPNEIPSTIQQISATFMTTQLAETWLPFLSLHTEHAFGYSSKNQFSTLLQDLPTIQASFTQSSRKRMVPRLWHTRQWSKEFAIFLQRITRDIDAKRIKIIEVHPPFSDYCQSLEEFLDRFQVFEEAILRYVPDVTLHIENRANQGTSYPTNKKCGFLLASSHDILQLSDILSKKETRLKIVLDFPALLTQHYGAAQLSQRMIETVFATLSDCSMIDGIHIWGKTIGKRGTSHKGNLDTYFAHNQEVKEFFLHTIFTLLHDGQPRYFVPEVASGYHDFLSIIHDFQQAGFEFMT